MRGAIGTRGRLGTSIRSLPPAGSDGGSNMATRFRNGEWFISDGVSREKGRGYVDCACEYRKRMNKLCEPVASELSNRSMKVVKGRLKKGKKQRIVKSKHRGR